MANFTTSGGVTWSDEEGFDAQSIIDFYNQIQANKRADSQERRAEDRLEMARDEISRVKDKESKMIQSQRFLNQAIMAHNKSGWNEEGVYTGAPGNSRATVESYLGNMRNIGQAGDAWTVSNALGTVKAKNLQDDINILNNKASIWAANNQHRKGWGGDFEDAQKEYLKKIGADKLFADYSGIVGKDQASMTMGQFAPESLAKDDSWNWKDLFSVDTGVKGAGLFWAGKTAINEMSASIARGEELKTNMGKGQELINKLDSEIKALKKDGTKAQKAQAAKVEKWTKVIKQRGYLDKATHKLLKKEADKIEELKPNLKDLKEKRQELRKAKADLKKMPTPTRTSKILKRISDISLKGKATGLGRGYLGFEAGSKLAESLGGGELTQLGSGIAAPVLAKKLIKPSNIKKLIPVISKVSPKLAQKLTLSAAGTLLPEGISTIAGIGGIMLMLNDIMELTSNPEVADVINSLE